MNTPKLALSGKISMRVSVSPTGRLSIPSELRRAVGLENGGTVLMDMKDGEIRIRTVQEALDNARRTARRIMGGAPLSVEAFLEFRREDSKE